MEQAVPPKNKNNNTEASRYLARRSSCCCTPRRWTSPRTPARLAARRPGVVVREPRRRGLPRLPRRRRLAGPGRESSVGRGLGAGTARSRHTETHAAQATSPLAGQLATLRAARCALRHSASSTCRQRAPLATGDWRRVAGQARLGGGCAACAHRRQGGGGGGWRRRCPERVEEERGEGGPSSSVSRGT